MISDFNNYSFSHRKQIVTLNFYEKSILNKKLKHVLCDVIAFLS